MAEEGLSEVNVDETIEKYTNGNLDKKWLILKEPKTKSKPDIINADYFFNQSNIFSPFIKIEFLKKCTVNSDGTTVKEWRDLKEFKNSDGTTFDLKNNNSFFKSMNIEDNGGFKTLTLVLIDRTFTTITQILKTAISEANANVNVFGEASSKETNGDIESAEIKEGIELEFLKTRTGINTNLKIQWGYNDENTDWYLKTKDLTGEALTKVQKENERRRILNEGNSNWTHYYSFTNARYTEADDFAKSSTESGDAVYPSEVLYSNKHQTTIRTPKSGLEFFITNITSNLTNTGVAYTITATSTENFPLNQTKIIQQYIELYGKPKDLLASLMNVFNKNENSPIRLVWDDKYDKINNLNGTLIVKNFKNGTFDSFTEEETSGKRKEYSEVLNNLNKQIKLLNNLKSIFVKTLEPQIFKELGPNLNNLNFYYDKAIEYVSSNNDSDYESEEYGATLSLKFEDEKKKSLDTLYYIPFGETSTEITPNFKNSTNFEDHLYLLHDFDKYGQYYKKIKRGMDTLKEKGVKYRNILLGWTAAAAYDYCDITTGNHDSAFTDVLNVNNRTIAFNELKDAKENFNGKIPSCSCIFEYNDENIDFNIVKGFKTIDIFNEFTDWNNYDSDDEQEGGFTGKQLKILKDAYKNSSGADENERKSDFIGKLSSVDSFFRKGMFCFNAVRYATEEANATKTTNKDKFIKLLENNEQEILKQGFITSEFKNTYKSYSVRKIEESGSENIKNILKSIDSEKIYFNTKSFAMSYGFKSDEIKNLVKKIYSDGSTALINSKLNEIEGKFLNVIKSGFSNNENGVCIYVNNINDYKQIENLSSKIADFINLNKGLFEKTFLDFPLDESEHSLKNLINAAAPGVSYVGYNDVKEALEKIKIKCNTIIIDTSPNKLGTISNILEAIKLVSELTKKSRNYFNRISSSSSDISNTLLEKYNSIYFPRSGNVFDSDESITSLLKNNVLYYIGKFLYFRELSNGSRETEVDCKKALSLNIGTIQSDGDKTYSFKKGKLFIEDENEYNFGSSFDKSTNRIIETSRLISKESTTYSEVSEFIENLESDIKNFTKNKEEIQKKVNEFNNSDVGKEISISLGSEDSIHKEKRYTKSISSLLNEFCSQCMPYVDPSSVVAEHEVDENGNVNTVIRYNETNKQNLSWNIIGYVEGKNIPIVGLRYKTPIIPDYIRKYSWGLGNKNQHNIKELSISTNSEFAMMNNISVLKTNSSNPAAAKINNYGRTEVSAIKSFNNSDIDGMTLFPNFILDGDRTETVFNDLTQAVCTGAITTIGDPSLIFSGEIQPYVYPIYIDIQLQSEGKSWSDDDDDNAQVSHLSGFYLVNKITHNISNAGYITTMEIMKYPGLKQKLGF